MSEVKELVDIKEAGKEILKAIGNIDYSQIDNPNEDFRRGAMWGMAWAMSHIYAYAPKYSAKIEVPEELKGDKDEMG